MAVRMWILRSSRPLQVDGICHTVAIRIGSTDLDNDDTPAMYIYFMFLFGVYTELWAHELGKVCRNSSFPYRNPGLGRYNILSERIFHSSLLWENERREPYPTLLYAGAIIANCFLNFLYAVSAHGSWVIIAPNPSLLECFVLCLVTKRPQLVLVAE